MPVTTCEGIQIIHMKIINPANNPVVVLPLHVGATSQEIAGKLLGTRACTVAFARIEPGGGSEIDAHPHSEQVFFVLKGVFTLRDDKKNDYTAEAGQALYVAPGEPHAAMNLGKEETVCIVVTAPPQ